MAEKPGEEKNRWIDFYYIPAGVLAIITVIAAFSDEADAWPVLILAGICILVPNLDRLQSIQVTTSGIMADLRKATADAHTLTDEAKRLLETLSRSTIDATALSLELVQRSGWVGGFEEDAKHSIRESAVKTLKETGVTDDEIDRIMYRTWYRYDFYTYATCILGRATVPDFGRPPPFNAQDRETTERANRYIARIREEWRALRDRWPNEPATPDELAAFIEKTGDDDAGRQRLLEAYRYYREHRTHLDMDLWENRGKIPQMKVSRIVEDGE